MGAGTGPGPARSEIREMKKEIKSFFLFFLTHFQIQFKLKFNSFANFNQTKASQNKYAEACMHIHVCSPIFDFIFNKVIIFLNLNAHKMHNKLNSPISKSCNF